jgi:hypothetical protein
VLLSISVSKQRLSTLLICGRGVVKLLCDARTPGSMHSCDWHSQAVLHALQASEKASVLAAATREELSQALDTVQEYIDMQARPAALQCAASQQLPWALLS